MTQLIQTIFFSIIIVYLLDYLLTYFRDTYTTKKTKDVVGFHIKKYQSIVDEMRGSSYDNTNSTMNNVNTLSKQELLSMNEELESLLQLELSPDR
jgi:hypothetical protein